MIPIELLLLGSNCMIAALAFVNYQVCVKRKDLEGSNSSLEKSLSQSKNDLSFMINQQFQNFSQSQKNQLELIQKQIAELEKLNEIKFDSIRNAVSTQLGAIQQQTSEKLESIRATVEEKLHDTLEKRLGNSFKLVNEQLEQVYRGLGEMQTIASGVGDLKKVLTNVKTRGIWGELQLANIIEQILTPDQYEKNVVVIPGASNRVEFAIKIPSEKQAGKFIWLPIDAKFPIESYYRLIQANDNSEPEIIAQCVKDLEQDIKLQAKMIADKYLQPPHTADFAIMFLPVEALYAEVLRKPGIIESLQRDYKIIITGPTTLSAILNSLQMGFRTMAIEQRSHEVWRTLSNVKSEFLKFANVLAKTKTKLDQASKEIEQVETRTRVMQRQLKHVETNKEDGLQIEIAPSVIDNG